MDGYNTSVRDMIKVYPDTEKRKEALRVLSDCKDKGMSYPNALANVQKAISGGNWENVPVIPETGRKAEKSQDGRKAARTDGKKKSGSDPYGRKAAPTLEEKKTKSQVEKSAPSVAPADPSEGVNNPLSDTSAVGSDPVHVDKSPSESVQASEVVIDDNIYYFPVDGSEKHFRPITDDLKQIAAVYAEQIESISKTYIETIRNGDIKNPAKWAPDMMLYISDRIQKPDRYNIPLLDCLWSIFKRLCYRVSVLPTIEKFGMMVDIPSYTFSSMVSDKKQCYGQLTPADIQTLKKWRREAEQALSDDVTSSDGASVNKIFVLKAAYGWSEAPQTQRVEVVGAAPAAYPVLGQTE